jgi:FkbM family methyltransferase
MSDVLDFLPPEVRLTHTRHGLMLYPAQDRFVGRCLEAYGEYNPEEGKAFAQLLRPGNVVVEAGANLGSHTVPMARLVGPTGVIHAFEPQRPVFQILCANLALNNIANVHARQNGLGAAPEVLWISPPAIGAHENFGGVSIGSEGREAVDIVTIDSMDLQRCDLIKVDVEGMEEAVLRGGLETIMRLKPKLYVENDPGETQLHKSTSLIKFLRSLGYRLWWHLPALYSPENFRNFQRHLYTQNVVSINMLAIREDEEVTTNYAEVGADDDRPDLDAI